MSDDNTPTDNTSTSDDNQNMADDNKRSLTQKMKTGLIIAVVALGIIVFFQNTEPAKTKLLFVTIEMPRIILLLIAVAIGFLLGTMFGKRLLLGRKKT